MGLFEDFGTFLESRLDEFLQSNPELNLTLLGQEIKQQKKDTLQLISNLESQQKNLESKIVSLGQEISGWHSRIEKAKQGQRFDLAQEAEKRQASLLKDGNLTWQKMEEVKQKNVQAKKLMVTLEEKQRELNLKMEQLKKETKTYSAPNKTATNKYTPDNDLEIKFQQWEVEQELQKMKENLS